MSTGAESRVGWMAERWQPLAPGPRPPAPTWSASSLLMARASWSCSSSSPLLCGQACSASGGGPEPTAAEEAEGRGDTKAETQGG